jgi:hypothetical protein
MSEVWARRTEQLGERFLTSPTPFANDGLVLLGKAMKSSGINPLLQLAEGHGDGLNGCANCGQQTA